MPTVARDYSADSGKEHKIKKDANRGERLLGRQRRYKRKEKKRKRCQQWREITRPTAAKNTKIKEMPTVARDNSADGGDIQQKKL